MNQFFSYLIEINLQCQLQWRQPKSNNRVTINSELFDQHQEGMTATRLDRL